jgi:hypothetical protein
MRNSPFARSDWVGSDALDALGRLFLEVAFLPTDSIIAFILIAIIPGISE